MAYEQRPVEHVHEHSGVSAGMVAALVILAAAVIGLVVVLLMRSNNGNNANVATQPAATSSPATTVQQPATQQPPTIIQQRGAAPASTNRTVVLRTSDDAAIQAEIDRRIANAAALSTLGITTTVSSGRVTLVGHVSNNNLRGQAERIARGVTGVRTIDNQIVIVARQP
jgi:osmotically-inducible protein OsmY